MLHCAEFLECNENALSVNHARRNKNTKTLEVNNCVYYTNLGLLRVKFSCENFLGNWIICNKVYTKINLTENKNINRKKGKKITTMYFI